MPAYFADCEAGFDQVMLKASDLVEHPQGVEAAVEAVGNSAQAVRKRLGR